MADSHTKGTGERYILITSATVTSLLPEQPISLRALHALLFEGHFQKAVGGLEGLLLNLRIVRESSSAVMPGATRGVLCEEFRTAILREARRTGEAESEVRTRIDRDPVELAKVASVAVDALALKRPLDKEAVLRRLEEVVSPKKGEAKP